MNTLTEVRLVTEDGEELVEGVTWTFKSCRPDPEPITRQASTTGSLEMEIVYMSPEFVEILRSMATEPAV